MTEPREKMAPTPKGLLSGAAARWKRVFAAFVAIAGAVLLFLNIRDKIWPARAELTAQCTILAKTVDSSELAVGLWDEKDRERLWNLVSPPGLPPSPDQARQILGEFNAKLTATRLVADGPQVECRVTNTGTLNATEVVLAVPATVLLVQVDGELGQSYTDLKSLDSGEAMLAYLKKLRGAPKRAGSIALAEIRQGQSIDVALWLSATNPFWSEEQFVLNSKEGIGEVLVARQLYGTPAAIGEIVEGLLTDSQLSCSALVLILSLVGVVVGLVMMLRGWRALQAIGAVSKSQSNDRPSVRSPDSDSD